MRAKYPSTWLRTPNATRSMHERPRMSRYSEFYYLDCERGRLVRSSLARLIPPRQPRTYENGYFNRPLEKLLPPLEPHGQRGGGGIFGIEKGRRERECEVFELRLRAKEGRATPRFFSFSLRFFPLFQRGANRVSTSVLVHAHAVTNGHDRYPYLNTGRKY